MTGKGFLYGRGKRTTFMTIYYICICHILYVSDKRQLCCRKLLSVVLITYLQALVSVAQTQLPAGHHGLLGGPALSTDQTPALCPVTVRAQHLYPPLIAGPSACDSDLCGAKVLGTTKQSVDTHGPEWSQNNSKNLHMVYVS